jgi:D-sedoheptulose 7-phosphate isomerase
MPADALSNYLLTLSKLLHAAQFTARDGETLSLDEGAQRACDLIRASHDSGGKVMLIGNGGSAAIVSHMQNDLSKAVGVRAMVFTEAPLLTALSNDLGYNVAYERLTAQWAEAGDLLVAVSSSGQSGNILSAVEAARQRDCTVLTLSGFAADNPLRKMGDVNVYIASDQYGYVELAHQVICHYLTDRLSGPQPAIR